jgi:hypothetical protein
MKFTSTVALMACMLAASGLRVEAKRRVGMDCPMFMVPRCKDGEVYGKIQWGNVPNCYQTICVKADANAKRRVGMGFCPMFMVPRCKDGEVYGKRQWGNVPNCYQTICVKPRIIEQCPMFMVPRCKDGEVYGKKQWGNIPNCYQTICVKPRSLRSMGDPLFPAATECEQRCNEYRKKKMRYICLSDCIF